MYVATTNITVAAGIAVQVVGSYFSANFGTPNIPSPNQTLSVQYAGGPIPYPGARKNYLWVNEAVLGPCTLPLTATSPNNNNPTAYAILRSRSVSASGSAPTAPTAIAATGVSSNGYTANWNSVSGATGYFLDVSTNNQCGSSQAYE